jgi:hypothetical protein
MCTSTPQTGMASFMDGFSVISAFQRAQALNIWLHICEKWKGKELPLKISLRALQETFPASLSTFESLVAIWQVLELIQKTPITSFDENRLDEQFIEVNPSFIQLYRDNSSFMVALHSLREWLFTDVYLNEWKEVQGYLGRINSNKSDTMETLFITSSPSWCDCCYFAADGSPDFLESHGNSSSDNVITYALSLIGTLYGFMHSLLCRMSFPGMSIALKEDLQPSVHLTEALSQLPLPTLPTLQPQQCLSLHLSHYAQWMREITGLGDVARFYVDYYYALWTHSLPALQSNVSACQYQWGQSLFAQAAEDSQLMLGYQAQLAAILQWEIDLLCRRMEPELLHLSSGSLNPPVIVDVGGGSGALVKGLFSHPPLSSSFHYRLLDLPEVLAAAQTDAALSAPSSQLQWCGGNFFDSATIPGDGDLYILRNVLHDWNDVDAAQILANIAAVAPPQARLLICSAVAAEMTDPLPLRQAAAQLGLHATVIWGRGASIRPIAALKALGQLQWEWQQVVTVSPEMPTRLLWGTLKRS